MKKIILALALMTYGSMLAEAAAQRVYTGGMHFLSLDGVDGGFFNGAAGGGVTADVIVTTGSGAQSGEKHLGKPRYENFNVQFNLAGMDASVYQWIARSWTQAPLRKDGAISTANYDRKIISHKEFTGALITETTLPACDAAGKEPGFIKVGFSPEVARSAKPSGNLNGVSGTEQKRWLPGNFRLSIDGLDCTQIVRIESFTVKRKLAQDVPGESRDPARHADEIEFPNLRIILKQWNSESWQAWLQDFVVNGNNGSGGEKNGKLEFLSADRREVLATVEFNGLGIFRLEPIQEENDAVGRVSADLYCEKMAFIPASPVR